MALLMDGEEIVGAKQDRALNTTVLLAPKSRTMIPVSCVEMGRWHYSSKTFESHSRTMNADMRKSKSMSVNEHLNRTGRFTADQGQVWYEIDRKYDRMCVDSTSTMAMSAIYESMKSPSEAYMKRFRPITGCGLEYENEILHLSVFPKDQKKTREVVSSFSRASSRRKAGQPEEERPPDDIIID